MATFTEQVEEIIRSYGGARMGITTRETLAGGPPSADLTYILPEAKSAITFALPLNQKFIRPFLAKEDRLSHERDNLQVNILATGLAAHIAKHLEQKGFPYQGVVVTIGTAKGIDRDGALMLVDDHGIEQRILAGDVIPLEN